MSIPEETLEQIISKAVSASAKRSDREHFWLRIIASFLGGLLLTAIVSGVTLYGNMQAMTATISDFRQSLSDLKTQINNIQQEINSQRQNQ
jgi:CHASE3 domain sensor protein